MQVNRREFYNPEDIFYEVDIKIKQLEIENKHADYLSFVPDGEPTLDLNLGKTISILKPYNIKIVLLTNASLIWMDEVKDDLMKADWVIRKY
jgi:wyosine [tRNA(Phe)-imidazoG37] synthetase (radical SAM superfamily)